MDTAHNIIGPYCHTCGVFASAAGAPGNETCEKVLRASKAEEERVDAEAKTFCAAHPDGFYWVEYEGQLEIGRLSAGSCPRVWRVHGADETENYHGIGIDSVTVVEGPIPPPAGRTIG